MNYEEAKTVQVGDVLWYATGRWTASRVRVLELVGEKPLSSFRVEVIDRIPTQEDCHARWFVSWRKCEKP